MKQSVCFNKKKGVCVVVQDKQNCLPWGILLIHLNCIGSKISPNGHLLTFIVLLTKQVIYLDVQSSIDTAWLPSGRPRQLGNRSGQGAQLGSEFGHKF